MTLAPRVMKPSRTRTKPLQIPPVATCAPPPKSTSKSWACCDVVEGAARHVICSRGVRNCWAVSDRDVVAQGCDASSGSHVSLAMGGVGVAVGGVGETGESSDGHFRTHAIRRFPSLAPLGAHHSPPNKQKSPVPSAEDKGGGGDVE